MQVAINNNIYTQAQIYALQKGQDLSTMIENYLRLYIQRNHAAEKQAVPDAVESLLEAEVPIEVSPRVANLLTGRSWNVSDDELDSMRYEYLAEKYK